MRSALHRIDERIQLVLIAVVVGTGAGFASIGLNRSLELNFLRDIEENGILLSSLL